MSIAQKKCPMCAEEIPLTSLTCEFCGAKFEVINTGYCPGCHEVREADGNCRCKVCGNTVVDWHLDSRFVEEPVQERLSVAQTIAQAKTTNTRRSDLPTSFLAAILVFALIGVLLWFGRTSLPAVSNPFTTVTPTATTASTPTLTPLPTLTPTRTPHPTPTITLDPRVLNPANQHRYLYVKEMKSWHQARDYCASQGGHLATIQDTTENSFVYNLTTNNDQVPTWLGATDDVKEGTWLWVTGENWNYSVWKPGEPTNNNGRGMPQHYLQFQNYALDWPSTFWDDVEDGTQYFVCEWESASE